MTTYLLLNSNSRDSSILRRSAARPPSFARFAGRRHYPPIQIARQIRPAKRAYVAMPMAFFSAPIADEACKLVARHAERIVDPRGLFLDNSDWRRRCGRILRGCDAVYVLTTPDKELSAGCYTEVAYAYALGLPVHVISWRLRGKPKLELGGEIVPVWDWDWTWWRAAQYRSPGRGERMMHKFRESATRIETMSAAAFGVLFAKPKEKAADRQSTGGPGA